jgi:hypothetical protein
VLVFIMLVLIMLGSMFILLVNKQLNEVVGVHHVFEAVHSIVVQIHHVVGSYKCSLSCRWFSSCSLTSSWRTSIVVGAHYVVVNCRCHHVVVNVNHVVIGVHYVRLFFQVLPLLFICNCQWSMHCFFTLWLLLSLALHFFASWSFVDFRWKVSGYKALTKKIAFWVWSFFSQTCVIF